MDDARLARCQAALAECFGQNGWGYDVKAQYEFARFALRRWDTFAHRTKATSPTHEMRINDLRKGLQQRFDPSSMDSIVEWRWIAGELATAIVTSE